MSTKIVTGKVRFSFCNIWEPKASQDGGDPKYSITLLIPKSDTATAQKIKEAIQEARDNFCNKNGASALPATPIHPLHDGDGTKPSSGEPYGPECKGCWVIAASSKQKPVIVDAFRNEITDPGEVYSGCYGRASINFYGYNNKKKGIGAGLLSIQKLSDGEPFGTVGSADDFDDDYKDADADVDFL
jgi:hypothetical protein